MKLRDMVTTLEHEVVKEKAFSAELQMQLEALEAIKKVLKSEVDCANKDAEKLKEKVELFEAKIKEQTLAAAEFTAKEESVQSERTTMEHPLEAGRFEVVKTDKHGELAPRRDCSGEVAVRRLRTEMPNAGGSDVKGREALAACKLERRSEGEVGRLQNAATGGRRGEMKQDREHKIGLHETGEIHDE